MYVCMYVSMYETGTMKVEAEKQCLASSIYNLVDTTKGNQ